MSLNDTSLKKLPADTMLTSPDAAAVPFLPLQVNILSREAPRPGAQRRLPPVTHRNSHHNMNRQHDLHNRISRDLLQQKYQSTRIQLDVHTCSLKQARSCGASQPCTKLTRMHARKRDFQLMRRSQVLESGSSRRYSLKAGFHKGRRIGF